MATGKEKRVSLRNVRIYNTSNVTKTDSANARAPFPSEEGDLDSE